MMGAWDDDYEYFLEPVEEQRVHEPWEGPDDEEIRSVNKAIFLAICLVFGICIGILVMAGILLHEFLELTP